MKKNKVITIIIIAVIIITSIVFMFMTNRTKSSEEGAYLNGEKIQLDNYIIKEEDNYFINYSILEENKIIDSFNDVDSKYIQIFYEYQIYEINYNIESNTFIKKENNIFINYDYIKSKTDFSINIYKNGDFLYIENNNTKGITTDKTKLRTDTSISSKIYTKLTPNEEFVIYEYYQNWAFIRFNEHIGYIKLDDIKSTKSERTYKLKELSTNKNLVVGWDLFNRKAESIANDVYYEDLDVIAPTWHTLDNEEIMTDWYLEEYYDYYKNKGVDFWGVFNNAFNRDLTSLYLRDRDRRKNVIEKIIKISKEHEYDGINLDFENLHYEDRDYLTVFIKELYIESRRNNLLFSVDITALSESQNWSLIYDRAEISKYADYLILMAYDATTSPEQGIGPIASIPWIEKAVVQLKEITDNSNIILGVPFYTRLWEITESPEGIYRDSTALRVKSAQGFIEENEIPITYDNEAKQNYGEKKIDNTTYKIWIEDELSLGYRIDLIDKYKLKGIAIWALDYSTDELWMKINEKILN